LKIRILGQYKTGTTALFHLIRQALPADTALLFEPERFTPEPRDRKRNILAKVMLDMPGPQAPNVDYDSFAGFDHTIYVLRDPRDWLISGTLFLVQQEQSLYGCDENLQAVYDLLRRKESRPGSISICHILERIMRMLPGERSLKGLTEWITQQHRWLFAFEDSLAAYHSFRYEDMIDGRLNGLQSYLGIPLSRRPDVPAHHEHVIRTRSYGNWRHWFTERDIRYFKPVFEAYMQRYGYDADWRLADHPAIPKAHCSAYVKRTVDKKRSLFI
jgi:hypothetical protein